MTAELVVGALVLFAVLAGLGVTLRGSFRSVASHEALVINSTGAAHVRFSGALVLPIIQRAEVVDLRPVPLEFRFDGPSSISCRDGVRFDVRCVLVIRVNRTAEDVLKVAQTLGAAKARDEATLSALFEARVKEAVRTVFAQLRSDDVLAEPGRVKDAVFEELGMDLEGLVLDDLSLPRVEQVPLEHLDKNNLLDAEGIRVITERTSRKEIEVNQLKLHAAEALLELERVRLDALARFNAVTGQGLTEAELERRLDERLGDLRGALAKKA